MNKPKPDILLHKIKRLEAALEFDSFNKLHKKIGFDKWMIYRPRVPDYIPKEQAALYVLKLVKKERKKWRMIVVNAFIRMRKRREENG